MLLRSLLALPVATTMAGAQVPARDLEVFVDSVIKATSGRPSGEGGDGAVGIGVSVGGAEWR